MVQDTPVSNRHQSAIGLTTVEIGKTEVIRSSQGLSFPESIINPPKDEKKDRYNTASEKAKEHEEDEGAPWPDGSELEPGEIGGAFIFYEKEDECPQRIEKCPHWQNTERKSQGQGMPVGHTSKEMDSSACEGGMKREGRPGSKGRGSPSPL